MKKKSLLPAIYKIKSFRFLALSALLMLAPPVNTRVYAISPDEIYSQYAVLMDADTGQVLYDKNMDAVTYPASTTKIMTGIIAVEKCFPGEILTVSKSALDINEPESSNIALSPGEKLSFDNAMYAMMLPSANDAANVIAEHVAGSQEKFAELMNEKAGTVGAVNTHFTNAHGLHDNDHYTTAYDLALITRYAAGNENFMRYFGADLYTMPPTNLQKSERPFTNYQYMLVSSTRYYDESVLGGKIGYTSEARHTMSTIAKRDGRTLICVTMGSANRNEKFYDAQKLLDFGFGEFTKHTIPAKDFDKFSVPVMDSGEEAGEAFFKAGSDFSFLLHNSADPSAVKFDYTVPEFVEKGRKAEVIVSLIADNKSELVPSLLITTPLKVEIETVAADVAAAKQDENLKPTADNPGKTFYTIILICSIALFVFSLMMIRRYNIYRRRKARLQRLNKRMRAYSPSGQNDLPRGGGRYSA